MGWGWGGGGHSTPQKKGLFGTKEWRNAGKDRNAVAKQRNRKLRKGTREGVWNVGTYKTKI